MAVIAIRDIGKAMLESSEIRDKMIKRAHNYPRAIVITDGEEFDWTPPEVAPLQQRRVD